MTRRFIALTAGLGLTVAGCTQQGDFGRPAVSAWNAGIDATGAIAAAERGEPASPYPLTDDEDALRDRAWRFLMPTEPRTTFADILANLTRARVLPATWRPRDASAYYARLAGDAVRSPYARYRRLSDDAAADGRLLPPFAATAAAVLDADARRLGRLSQARTVEGPDFGAAIARVEENRCLVAWVRLETGLRAAGYRYALEHLFIATPSRESVVTERTVAFAESRRAVLEPLLPPDAEARCGLIENAPATLASPIVAKY